MQRGGKRAGTPGRSYSNRSDLNKNRTLPPQAPTGLPYGQHQQLVQQQQTEPLRRAPPVAPAASPAAAPAAAPAGGPPPVMPGPRGPLDRPTERPHEPLTAGAPFGPGPGTEALARAGPVGGMPLSAIIEQAAAASGSPELQFLAQQARSQGQ